MNALVELPAIQATHPTEFVSNRYRFMSSREIVEHLSTRGWFLSNVSGVKTRLRNAMFAPHVMVFSRNEEGRSYSPRLIVRNGHDGVTGLQIRLGFKDAEREFIASQEFFGINLRHMQAGQTLLNTFLDKAEENINKLYQLVQEMKNRTLTEAETTSLFRRAIIARWNDPDKSRSACVLNKARILEGTNGNLFEIFVRLQDAILGGGYYEDTVAGRKKLVRVRAIRSGVKEVKFRQELWKAAAEFFQANGAAAA